MFLFSVFRSKLLLQIWTELFDCWKVFFPEGKSAEWTGDWGTAIPKGFTKMVQVKHGNYLVVLTCCLVVGRAVTFNWNKVNWPEEYTSLWKILTSKQVYTGSHMASKSASVLLVWEDIWIKIIYPNITRDKPEYMVSEHSRAICNRKSYLYTIP